MSQLIEDTVEAIDGFIINFDKGEIQALIENYIYAKLYKKLFAVSDDEEMKNVQIREKIKILQQYVKPSMLSIEQRHLNMKVLSKAIQGPLTRDAEDQRGEEPQAQVRSAEQRVQDRPR